jgi:deoxyribodipyrimidine photo-lyase
MKRILVLLNRDLRIRDNTALTEAISSGEEVYPIFIFTPEQIDKKNNPYFSKRAYDFMCSSLKRIESHLSLFYGPTEEILSVVLKEYKFDAVFVNRDYTPFARSRESMIHSVCSKNNITCKIFADTLLHEPEQIRKKDGTYYSVFTPFYNVAKTLQIRKNKNNLSLSDLKKLQKIPSKYLEEKKQEKDITRKTEKTDSFSLKVCIGDIKKTRFMDYNQVDINPEKVLKNLEKYQAYEKERDIPSLDATTHLSAHLKFGTVSIREVYHRMNQVLGAAHPLLRQLYWRNFWTHIAYNVPHVFEGSFYKRYDKLTWSEDTKGFEKWCNGMTGFPIVDAGMRELNETGYMHNRVRMIVASFLTKDLHISWRWGERYFAKKLIDYDPSVNNGNWQWAASTGCDAQPYFRIFNPWLQQKKFDLECNYIKKWIPELRDFSTKEIHNDIREQKIGAYPKPILNHKIEKEKTLALYKSV